MTETEGREIEIMKKGDIQTEIGQKHSFFKVDDQFFTRINRWFNDFWWPFEIRIRFPLSKEKS